MERLNQKDLFPSFSSCRVGTYKTISCDNSDSESDLDEIYPAGGSDVSSLESSLDSSLDSSDEEKTRSEDAMEEDLGGEGGSDESALKSSLDSSEEEKTSFPRSEDAIEEDLGGAGRSDESALKSSLDSSEEEKTSFPRSEDAIEEDLGGAGGSDESALKSLDIFSSFRTPLSEDAIEEDIEGAKVSEFVSLEPENIDAIEEDVGENIDAIEEDLGGAKDGQVSEFVSLDPENIDAYGPLDRGKKVNMISLLSSSSRDFLVDKNGCQVKVSSLKDRYVLMHCFTLPVHSYSRIGNICWVLKSACSKWSNFQLVVVAKMSPGIEHDFEAFHSFVSAFPSCLAIPFEDSYSYNRVSHFIGLERCIDALVLDPNGTVLQQRCSFLIQHGLASFPFTDDHFFNLVDVIEKLLDERPVPLEYLLGLQLSDSLSNAAADDTISVSDLKQKLVGLYLCCNGELLDTFNMKYQECQANNRELVIVVVYRSFADDPQHFMACTDAVLRDKNISWWVLPFDDSTVRRLWQLCDESEKDELIIVGPQGEFLEPKAGNAIIRFNPEYDMYPYASEPLAHQETARLKELTLESLLPSTNFLTRKGDLMHVTELRGKNVVLFIVDLRYENARSYGLRPEDGHSCGSTLRSMAIWCRKNEGYKDSDTKLVFVPINASKSMFDFTMSLPWLQDSAMSWLICPPNPCHEASIIKHIILKGTQWWGLSYIAFGEDGHIISTAYPVSSQFGTNGFLPDQLYQDVLGTYTDLLED